MKVALDFLVAKFRLVRQDDKVLSHLGAPVVPMRVPLPRVIPLGVNTCPLDPFGEVLRRILSHLGSAENAVRSDIQQ
jgi:hypothetical protein